MARADRFTLTQKRYVIYSDIGTNLDMNPFTGSLAKVENEEAVKKSIRNLLLTQNGERFYDSNKGSPVGNALFENLTVVDHQVLKMQIQALCQTYEPRATILDVIVNNPEFNIDQNELKLTIVFTVQNILEETFELDFVVKRVR